MTQSFAEFWRDDGDDTFGHAPLEMERKAVKGPWRGVSFASVVEELYYEVDGFDIDNPLRAESVCAATGQEVYSGADAEDPLAFCRSFEEVRWNNLVHVSLAYLGTLDFTPPEFRDYIFMGLSNAVSVNEVTYEHFRLPHIVGSSQGHSAQREALEYDLSHTLILAVAYTPQDSEWLCGAQQAEHEQPVLKANDFQVAQMECILEAIRDNPPDGTQYIRLWTDEILHSSFRSRGWHKDYSMRSKYMLYGLLPYSLFGVALLYPDDTTDAMSMWSSCRQILADAGCGCFFSTLVRKNGPPLCKDLLDTGNHFVRKTVGDGISIFAGLRRLSTAIHSGAMDDMITDDIAEAHSVVKLAYFISRKRSYAHHEALPTTHGFNCPQCLHVSQRELHGFYFSLQTCADMCCSRLSEENQARFNLTRLSLPFPKVRARYGYERWHGVREFLPGAGRFAKFMIPKMTTEFRQHQYVMKLDYRETNSEEKCVTISAVPCDEISTAYVALYVQGWRLFQQDTEIQFSVRLNIVNLNRLHQIMSNLRAGRPASQEKFLISSMFRHPQHGTLLEHLRFTEIVKLSSLSWNGEKPDDKEQFALQRGDHPGEEWLNGRETYGALANYRPEDYVATEEDFE